MLRFSATDPDGKLIVGMGITAANVERLRNGEPILVRGETVNSPVDFFLFYGETLEELNKLVSPFVDKETKIHIDPLLSVAPENARTKPEGQVKLKRTV